MSEINLSILKKQQRVEQRVTLPILTKFEKTRILSTRANQITQNAAIQIELNGEIDPLKIAELEFKQGKIPLIIRRHLPNGTFEDWHVNELKEN